jgi:hypothetical protein
VKLTRGSAGDARTLLAFRRRDPNLYSAAVGRGGGDRARRPGGRADPRLRQDLGSHREQAPRPRVLARWPPNVRTHTSAAGEDTLEEHPSRQSARSAGHGRCRASARCSCCHLNPTHNAGQLTSGGTGSLRRGGRRRRAQGRRSGQVPGGNSQSLDNLYGKILRIDPGRRATGRTRYRPTTRSRDGRRAGDLAVRTAQPVAVLLRPATNDPGSATSARTTGRRSTGPAGAPA